MKKTLFFVFILSGLFAWLLLESNTLLFYRVTEVRKGSRVTRYKVDFSRQAFVNYIKRKISLQRAAGPAGALSGLELSTKEQESIKKIFVDGSAKADKMMDRDKDIGEEIKKMIEDYRNLMKMTHDLK